MRGKKIAGIGALAITAIAGTAYAYGAAGSGTGECDVSWKPPQGVTFTPERPVKGATGESVAFSGATVKLNPNFSIADPPALEVHIDGGFTLKGQGKEVRVSRPIGELPSGQTTFRVESPAHRDGDWRIPVLAYGAPTTYKVDLPGIFGSRNMTVHFGNLIAKFSPEFTREINDTYGVNVVDGSQFGVCKGELTAPTL